MQIRDLGTDLPTVERRGEVRNRVATASACGYQNSALLAAAAGSHEDRVARTVALTTLMRPIAERMTERLAELRALHVEIHAVVEGDEPVDYATASVVAVGVFHDRDGTFAVDVDVDSVAKHYVLFGS